MSNEAKPLLYAVAFVSIVVAVFFAATSDLRKLAATSNNELSPDVWKPYIALHHARAQVVEGFEE